MRTLISVIIPTYKPQDYIWACLDSLVNQTFDRRLFEVILVLNGCNEPYAGRLKKYIQLYMSAMKVVFIQTDQGGVSQARNLALDRAQGEFIAFLDDDDYVSPRYLEALYVAAHVDRIAIAYPYAFDDGKDTVQLPYPMSQVFERWKGAETSLTTSARKFFSGPCMKLIPASIIGGRRFDVKFKNGEDSIFMFLISDRVKSLKFASSEAVYYRRFRENSAVTTRRKATDIIGNAFRMMAAFTGIYLKRPRAYLLSFYLTRMMAVCRSIIVNLSR